MFSTVLVPAFSLSNSCLLVSVTNALLDLLSLFCRFLRVRYQIIWFSLSTTSFTTLCFELVPAFHLFIALSFFNIFNEQYVFLHSFHFFVFCACFLIITLSRLEFSVGSVPVESLYVIYRIATVPVFSPSPCIFPVFSVGIVPTASLCSVLYWCLFSHSLTLYFLCVSSGQFFCSFTLFCTLLMPIFSLSHLVFSLCF